MWLQQEINLRPKSRGFHLVTGEIIDQLDDNLKKIKAGLAHLFIRHTSASLTINENADPSVRVDMENYFNHTVPEMEPYFTHTLEGPDDMPAHLKTVMIGCELTIPVSNGRLMLGTWQGIYLCEHRDYGGKRKLIVTLTGEPV